MSRSFTESVVEEAALAWLANLGYAVLHGPDIAVGRPRNVFPTYLAMGDPGNLRISQLDRDTNRDAVSRLFRQTIGIGDAHAGNTGNPDSNPDKVSGYGPADSKWRRIPTSSATSKPTRSHRFGHGLHSSDTMSRGTALTGSPVITKTYIFRAILSSTRTTMVFVNADRT